MAAHCIGLCVLDVFQAPALGHPASRFLILALCGLSLLALAAAVTRGAPLKLLVGEDNRYSNSKFQVALWFWVVITTYLATIIFRVWTSGWNMDFLGGVAIPEHLLVLSGLSALTYGGAKAITTGKANAATNPDPKRALSPGQERLLRDLVQNDFGQFDFGDFQMLVVTFLAVLMYLTMAYHFLGSADPVTMAKLPDVDSTLLAMFGLGQGAYLTKKAAGNIGTS